METISVVEGERITKVLAQVGKGVLNVLSTVKNKVVSVAKDLKNKITDKLKSIDWKKVKTQIKESVKKVKEFTKQSSILGYERLKTVLLKTGIRLSERQKRDLEKLQQINKLDDVAIDKMPQDKMAELTSKLADMEKINELYEKIIKGMAAQGLNPVGNYPAINSGGRLQMGSIATVPRNNTGVQAFIAGFKAGMNAGKEQMFNDMVGSMANPRWTNAGPTPAFQGQGTNTVDPKAMGANAPKANDPKAQAPEAMGANAPKTKNLISVAINKIAGIPAAVRDRVLNMIDRGFSTINVKDGGNKERTAQVFANLSENLDKKIEAQRSKNADILEEYKNARKDVQKIREELAKQQQEEEAMLNEGAGVPMLRYSGFISGAGIWIFLGALGAILEFGVLFISLLFK